MKTLAFRVTIVLALGGIFLLLALVVGEAHARRDRHVTPYKIQDDGQPDELPECTYRNCFPMNSVLSGPQYIDYRESYGPANELKSKCVFDGMP